MHIIYILYLDNIYMIYAGSTTIYRTLLLISWRSSLCTTTPKTRSLWRIGSLPLVRYRLLQCLEKKIGLLHYTRILYILHIFIDE